MLYNTLFYIKSSRSKRSERRNNTKKTYQDEDKKSVGNIEQVLATTPHETPTVRPLTSHHENYTG